MAGGAAMAGVSRVAVSTTIARTGLSPSPRPRTRTRTRQRGHQNKFIKLKHNFSIGYFVFFELYCFEVMGFSYPTTYDTTHAQQAIQNAMYHRKESYMDYPDSPDSPNSPLSHPIFLVRYR